MPRIDQLPSVNLRELVDKNKSAKTDNSLPGAEVKDFGETISDFVQAVDDAQKNASVETADIIQGKSQNLHQAMASLEESRLSFQLMIEIRNKLLESYKEVQRMQV